MTNEFTHWKGEDLLEKKSNWPLDQPLLVKKQLLLQEEIASC